MDAYIKNYNYYQYSYKRKQYTTEKEYRQYIDELTTKLQES